MFVKEEREFCLSIWIFQMKYEYIYDHIITYMMIFYESYISKWKYEYIWRVFIFV